MRLFIPISFHPEFLYTFCLSSGNIVFSLVYIIQGVKSKRDGQGFWRDAKLLEQSMARSDYTQLCNRFVFLSSRYWLISIRFFTYSLLCIGLFVLVGIVPVLEPLRTLINDDMRNHLKMLWGVCLWLVEWARIIKTCCNRSQTRMTSFLHPITGPIHSMQLFKQGWYVTNCNTVDHQQGILEFHSIWMQKNQSRKKISSPWSDLSK